MKRRIFVSLLASCSDIVLRFRDTPTATDVPTEPTPTETSTATPTEPFG